MPLGVLALSLLVPVAAVQAMDATDTIPTLSHADLSKEVAALESSFPELVQISSVGTSREGRALEALRITAPGDAEARPAILLVAGLEGPRLYESGVALHHARGLARGYASDEAVQALLEHTVVYVIPRANPDAAEARFGTPLLERTTSGHGVDNDRDGRQGEDAPQDVNGDGLVTWMRIPDPEGTWMADPNDDRALVEADRTKGERGVWKLVREGRDLDGDEAVAEDPPNDTLLNRTFPSGWDELAPDAGLFPSDEPEARALIEFVHGHPELALVVVYDGMDNLVEAPGTVADDAPRQKRIPPAGWLQSDADLLAELGTRYEELVESGVAGGADDAGSFQRWCYDHRGLWTLSMRLWELPDEAPEVEDDDSAETPEAEESLVERGEGEQGEGEQDEELPDPSLDAKHLSWIDASADEAWRFVDWESFDHPELGSVEIGGFAPYAHHEPPAATGREIADAHFEFFLTLGEVLPRVDLVSFETKKLGDGLWRVEAVVESGSTLLPLRSRSAARTRTIRPARVRLDLPEAATLVSGRRQELLGDLGGGGDRAELTWLVSGPAGMEVGVTIDTDNAGAVRRVEEVR